MNTKAIYDKYSSRYMDFCTNKSLLPFNEISMIKFMLNMKRKYSPGCFWSIYSCINNIFETFRRFKLQQYIRLTCIMKRLTDKYCPDKAKIFLEDQIHDLFEKLYEEDPKSLVTKVRIFLMYYGLLSQNEVIKIRVSDVSTKEEKEIAVKYCFVTNTKTQIFNFKYLCTLSRIFVSYYLRSETSVKSDSLASFKNTTSMGNAIRRILGSVWLDSGSLILVNFSRSQNPVTPHTLFVAPQLRLL